MVTDKTWNLLVGSAIPPECATCRVELRRDNTSRVQRADGTLGLEHEACGEVHWTALQASQLPPRAPPQRHAPALRKMPSHL